ncbi:Quinone oxidoreductase PIG3 [Nymphon striatum]|nr:Quinone oxidoreductase PIG3 [Nymphon striatum]
MNLPETMEAIEISTPGGPEVLEIAQRAIPSLDENEVLINVRAAGINRPDCLQRMGGYPPPPGASDIPGLEVAGEIVAVGSSVAPINVGKHVMALVPGGGYAEYVNVDISNTLTIPAGLSMEEAGAIPETFFTVWHNVFQRGGLLEGETFMVHGGTSGIGTTAIQLAKAFGATVITTAGTDEKCQACLSLGADHAINYRDEVFEERTKEITGSKGVDVILDMVGGSYTSRNYKAAAMDGRIVQIAFLGGPKSEANFMPIMLKRLTHTGSTLRARSVEFKAQIARELQEQVWPLIENGKVKPVMDSSFELKDARKAHERMESSGHIGKIVLKT